MRKLLALLSALASPALAQTPAGVINAPIYATGYISQVGGTNVTTNIPPQSNHPTNLNIYTTGAISGTWTIKLPNPAFEGQMLSFNCGAAANAISIVSSDGSSIDPNLPVSCTANGGFVTQFDLRSNIWRSLGSGYSANFRPFTGVTSQWPWQLNADGTWTLKQPASYDLSDLIKSNATVYADFSSGNDSNSCLSGSPCKTLQGAINKAQAILRNGYTVTISLADSSSYVQGVVSGNAAASWASGSLPGLVVQGNCATPANVVITGSNTNAVYVTNGARVQLQCVTLASTGSAGNGLQVDHGGHVWMDKIRFGSVVGTWFDASDGGYIYSTGTATYWLTGDAAVDGIHANEGGFITLNNPTFTCAGATKVGGDTIGVAGRVQLNTPTFTSCGSFINATAGTNVNGTISSGNGKRFFVHQFGTLLTGLSYPGNLTAIPGSNAGSTLYGGFIDYAKADGDWVYCNTTTSPTCVFTIYSTYSQLTSTNAGASNVWSIQNLGTTANTTSELTLSTNTGGGVHQSYLHQVEDGAGHAGLTLGAGTNVTNLSLVASDPASSIGFTAGGTFWWQMVGSSGALIPATSSQSVGDVSHWLNGLYVQQVVVKGGTSGSTILIASGTASGTLTLPATTGTLCTTSTCGSGIVNSGTAGQLAYYAGSGTTVSGTNAGTGVLTALGNALNGSGGLVGYSGNIGAATGTSLALTGGNMTVTYNQNAISSISLLNNNTGASAASNLQLNLAGGYGLNISASYNSGTPYFQITQGTATSAFLFDAQNVNFRDPNASYVTRLGITNTGITVEGSITTKSTTLHATSVSLSNGAAANTGTLTNAPAAGNPTKWIPINDNGTTRYIPAW